MINKDTKIYCSFSKTPGNKGCEFFNYAFTKHNINAIYKAFSIDNIYDAIKAAQTLKFSGCAISMPFKKDAFNMLCNKEFNMSCNKDDVADRCSSINTIIFNYENNNITGYNTDYYGAIKILSQHIINYKKVYIIGEGGLGKAVKAASYKLGFDVFIITRSNWNEINYLKNSLIYNCTPLTLNIDKSNCYIDCLIGTQTGDLLHKYQSREQFKLYTGIEYDE